MDTMLLIVQDDQAEPTLARVGLVARIVQRLPPRLAIIEADPGEVETVRSVEGVRVLCQGRVSEAVLRQLTSAERIFARAWMRSRQAKPHRPGDGLPWDAEGFKPPDP
jgi:hypothetical protein